MKVIVATVCLAVFSLAEPPPSNSYLPPSASSTAGTGYPRGPQGHMGPSFGGPSFGGPSFGSSAFGGPGFGGPEIVAARNLGNPGHHGFGFGGKHRGNGFGRSLLENVGAKGVNTFKPTTHRAEEDVFYARSLNEEDSGEAANYGFGYTVNDAVEGTDFGHHEERQDDKAEGEYHVVLPDGRKQTVSYEADEKGFKPRISYEDTEAGGYDSNANNLGGFGHGKGAGRNGYDSSGVRGHHSGHPGHDNHGIGTARSGGY